MNSEWNEKVRKAINQLPIGGDLSPTSRQVQEAFNKLLETDHGPAKPPKFTPVLNPKGEVWMSGRGQYARKHQEPHLKRRTCGNWSPCSTLNLEEAFRPGAVAEWTNPDDANRIVRGYVRSTIEVRDGRTLLDDTWRRTEELTLVTIAPEKSDG